MKAKRARTIFVVLVIILVYGSFYVGFSQPTSSNSNGETEDQDAMLSGFLPDMSWITGAQTDSEESQEAWEDAIGDDDNDEDDDGDDDGVEDNYGDDDDDDDGPTPPPPPRDDDTDDDDDDGREDGCQGQEPACSPHTDDSGEICLHGDAECQNGEWRCNWVNDTDRPNCTHRQTNINGSEVCQINGEANCTDSGWNCINWNTINGSERECSYAPCSSQGWNNSICNSPATGKMSLSDRNVLKGEEVTLTVTGQDPDGMYGVAYREGEDNWFFEECDREQCSHTWTIKKEEEGTYAYTGEVNGLYPDGYPNGTKEAKPTDPEKISLQVRSISPDLAITDIQARPLNPTGDNLTNVSVEVKNIGANETGGVIESKIYSTPDSASRVDRACSNITRSLLPLQKGEIRCPASGGLELVGGNYTLSVEIDPLNRIREGNETNNIRNISLEVEEGVNYAPDASFTYEPETPISNQTIIFNASSSEDSDGQIASYLWDLGDGATSEGRVIEHEYSSKGTYRINLTVTDNEGKSSNLQQEIKIKRGNRDPKASFNYQPQQAEPGDTINFDATWSKDPEGALESYSWKFGDGSQEEGVTIGHSYSQVGTYEVNLTITDNASATDSVTQTITVEQIDDPPVVSLSYPDDIKNRREITFDASSSYDPDPGGSITEYNWTFCPQAEGGCVHKEGETVKHTFQEAGTYNLTLVLSDDAGLQSQKSEVIEVSQAKPILYFSPNASTLVRDRNMEVNLVMDYTPNGLESFDLNLSIRHPSYLKFNTGSINSRFSSREVNNRDGERLKLQAIDLNGQVGEEAELVLGQFEISAIGARKTVVEITSGQIRDDKDELVEYKTKSLPVKIIEPLPPIGEAIKPPRDLDYDSLFMDVNGNGRLDSVDYGLYFRNYKSSAAMQQNRWAFDYNQDGELTARDLIILGRTVDNKG